jgi:NodT family efflux transporter outer membrane factor (OMF) lipoprotein
MKTPRVIAFVACALLGSLLSGCDLAPVYRQPQMILPATWHGDGPFETVRPGGELGSTHWWRVFADPQLDRLEDRLVANNPDLEAAGETYTQAQDIVAEARSQLFPQLSAQAFASGNRESVHTLFHTPNGMQQAPSLGYGAAASWEPDFWDDIRNRTRYAMNNAQASAAMVASAKLALELELAKDYVALRGLDREHSVYHQTVLLYTQAVTITQLRLSGRIASGIDVQRAQDQLASVQAADTAIEGRRAVLEHAIAVLCGDNPSTFHLGHVTGAPLAVPTIPAGVPSDLLQRRPDIAQAERQMAAANAAIGVARAAFYPNIRLSANSGFEDTGIALASLPNSLWAVGASAMLPLFEGGLRHAEEQASWSTFDEAGDRYRATVLDAFREVEDALVLTTRLATESALQGQATASALKVQKLALTRYTSGIDNYLNVTVAQSAALDDEIAGTQTHTQQLENAVALMGALGGGWTATELPTPRETEPVLTRSHAPAPGEREMN